MIGAMFDQTWNLVHKTNNLPSHPCFIDRNPDCFVVLLDLLRIGHLHVPHNISHKLLYREALYYGLLHHVRSATWGPFDGNR